MKINELKSTIREIIEKILSEGPATSPSKPKPSPEPTVAPGKPGEKPGPRRPLGNPNVKPKPKAMNEEEMLAKIVDRFKKNKDIQEMFGGPTPNYAQPKTWKDGYEEGYKAGFKDATNGKSSKF